MAGKHKGNGDEDERQLAEMRRQQEAADQAERIANAKKATEDALRIQREARERGDL
jgi:hypothetical protein